MAIIDLSVQKGRSFIKILSAAVLFVVGLVALFLTGAPKHGVTMGEQDALGGVDIAYADAPYSQGAYYGQASYSDYSCWDPDWIPPTESTGGDGGDGDGGSSSGDGW